jgi:hypothetical protein
MLDHKCGRRVVAQESVAAASFAPIEEKVGL